MCLTRRNFDLYVKRIFLNIHYTASKKVPFCEILYFYYAVHTLDRFKIIFLIFCWEGVDTLECRKIRKTCQFR